MKYSIEWECFSSHNMTPLVNYMVSQVVAHTCDPSLHEDCHNFEVSLVC